MKKAVFSCIVFIVLIACNSSSSEKVKSEGSSVDVTSNPDYQKGLTLVANNKCMTCHAISEVITGPSYSEVAQKYANSSDTIVAHLAEKIISGGNGIWSEIFMTPHPDVSKEDAEAMVRYILLLNKL